MSPAGHPSPILHSQACSASSPGLQTLGPSLRYLFPQCPAQLRAPALWGAPAEAGLGNCAESSFSVCTRARAHAHTRTQARHPLAGSCLVPSGISHPLEQEDTAGAGQERQFIDS